MFCNQFCFDDLINVNDILTSNDKRPLNEREQEILRRIVHLYILKASPIGSRFLSKYIQDQMKLSPATLRNIMSDLEDLEYISHPHTSAGRIPTDKGYRFYVNSMNNIEQLSPNEIMAVHGKLNQADNDSILKNASKVLGMLSKFLGVVEIPKLKEYIVEKIEIVPLSSTRVLVVLDLQSNIVRTVTLEAKMEFERSYLHQITNFLNERIAGKPLSFIKENFENIISDTDYSNTPLIRLFTNSLDKIFENNNTERVIITGTHNLLEYPEFEDLKRVRSVIELIENEDVIIHLLDKCDYQEGVTVLIGSELQNDILSDYSLIKTNYKFGSASGSIGLIGPKRMNYAKMMSIVKNVSDIITASSDNNSN